jgi:predicted N-acetyltransferase YhbS
VVPVAVEGSSLNRLLWDLDLMSSGKFEIRHETDGDEPILSQLSAEAFGPGRFTRSAYRVRENIPPVADLSLCGVIDGHVIGGVRFTEIRIGDRAGGLLLGPLIVDPAVAGRGFGKAMVEQGLARARDDGFSFVLLVGDMPYYARFGFQPVPPGQVILPGPVDPARLLGLELVSGALAGVTGMVKGCAG